MDSSEDARIARAPRGRVLGRIRGEAPGPTLVVVAGMHGNELGGVEAVRRVLARLGATEDAGGALAPDARGRALAGSSCASQATSRRCSAAAGTRPRT